MRWELCNFEKSWQQTVNSKSNELLFWMQNDNIYLLPRNCVPFYINNITFPSIIVYTISFAPLFTSIARFFFILTLEFETAAASLRALLGSSRTIAPSFAGLLRSRNTIAEVRDSRCSRRGKIRSLASGDSARIAEDIPVGPLTLLTAR